MKIEPWSFKEILTVFALLAMLLGPSISAFTQETISQDRILYEIGVLHVRLAVAEDRLQQLVKENTQLKAKVAEYEKTTDAK